MATLPLQGVAETLMMPDRDAAVGEPVVVWGVTDQAGNYTLDCGNGDVTGPVPVADGSYISKVCTYGTEAAFTAELTIGGESAQATVAAFDAGGLPPVDERGLRINMAIEDGLRWLWVNQTNRAANFPGATTTQWSSSWNNSETAMVALAFQNQGYTLPNGAAAPTGVYEKYIVQRALNRVFGALTTVTISSQPSVIAGQPVRDPCVGVGIEGSPCSGLQGWFRGQNGNTNPALTVDSFHTAYQTGVFILPIAASGALARVNTEAGPTNGMTYGEILQRMTNALAWGQMDTSTSGGRGGWWYYFNYTGSSDGSTIGWDILAILDAEAAGIIVPDWVKTEHAFAMDGSLNNDGTLDYQSNNNPASNNSVGPAKNGIGLQGLFLIGEIGGARVANVANTVDSWWVDGTPGIGGNSWNCGAGPNKGCGYTMYNNFKGLKLQGIPTLPSVGRPAGPGTIPENDWHEDYKDWLLGNQQAPDTVGGGGWGLVMNVSSQLNADAFETAIAELLLSPVALVLPDPIQFGEIGLQHCLDGVFCDDRTPEVIGDPTEDTNPVGTDHTVVSLALSINGDPIPGTTINIDILSGPNAPQNFQGQTDASGEVQVTYTSNGTVGTDEIQASIGNLVSNLLTKVWEGAGGEPCDYDGDGDIDRADVRSILRARGTQVPPGDPGDANGDGVIDTSDAKLCVRQL